ncbi:MAG: hypothetical protein U1F25_13600 [Rubrivivax sp.]
MRKFIVVFLSALVAALAACGGGGGEDMPPSCGSSSAQRVIVEPGLGAILLTQAVDVPARNAPWTMQVTLTANRFLETRSGVAVNSSTAQGGVAAYHFLRVYRNGVFVAALASTDRDELKLPIAPGCHVVRQEEHAAVQVDAGVEMRVEAVWSVVRPPRGAEDLTAITDSFSLVTSE